MIIKKLHSEDKNRVGKFREHVSKKCLICGHEFVVLKKVEEKAIYCTIKRLSAAQGRVKRGKDFSFIPV